ncbi:MAG: esterase-like activity of phytase family protein [Rhodobacteraceae bacterium]|nr:esterase-like activity of phytase family protein [Paracoccaceae bacterium]
MPLSSRHVLAALVAATAPAAAEETFPATLAGHAVLPAMTLIPPPADAPADARVSGKFTTGRRVDAPGTVPGDTGAMHGRRPTGLSLPFEGQPVQGFSGFAMAPGPDGSVWTVTDNGFGARANSPDALLFFHRLAPDFGTGTIGVRETVFLRDPDRVVPFRIAYEGTAERYLTGADFDLESIQVIGDTVWLGDEFGPWLISATTDGVVTGVYPTMLDGAELRSVDHPTVSGLSKAGTDWRVPRSGGYEGMALQPGTGLLWAMLEKPILGEDGEPEGQFLRAMAFDPAKGEWTGASFRFALAEGATAIGDFNFIDETRALVIERDNGEGDPSLKCAGEPAPDCFPQPAMLKRVVLIDTASIDAEGFVRRIGHIDLMDIADPDGLARLETAAGRDLDGRFTFPFFTIESVMAAEEGAILVGMDNNLPFSSGRRLDAAADNEVIRLSVPELLAAR